MKAIITNKFIVVTDPTNHVAKVIQKELSYTDKSVQYQLKRMAKNPFLKASAKYQELQGQVKGELFKWTSNGDLVFPTGFVDILNGLENLEIDDRRCLTGGAISLPWVTPPHNMRDYQEEAVALMENSYRGVIELATGLGKTLLAVHAIKRIKRKTLVICPSDSVAQQFYEIASKSFGPHKVGMFGGSKRKIADITIGIAASVNNHIEKFKNEDLGLVIGDECFPYRENIATDIGPKEIGWLVKQWEEGKSLPKIRSWNNTTQEFEYKKMTHGWRKLRNDLVDIKYSKRHFQCTPEHLLLTSNGWKKAKDINKGDLLLGESGNKIEKHIIPRFNSDQQDLVIGSYLGDGSIGIAGLNRFRLSFTHGVQQEEYAKWKASMLNGTSRIIKNNGFSKKDAIRVTSMTFDFSIKLAGPKCNVPQTIIDQINEKSLAIWYMDDGSVNKYGRGARLATCSFDYDSNLRLSSKLKLMGIDNKVVFHSYSGRRAPGYYEICISTDGYRHMAQLIAPFVHPSMGYKLPTTQCGSYIWNSTFLKSGYGLVDSVKFITNKVQKGRQPFVFDIEVEDNHNFVVCSASNIAGIVAHNCHHQAAETFYRITKELGHVGKIFGLTATNYRQDGKDILIKAGVGSTLIVRDVKWAIENNWLAKPKFIVKKVPTAEKEFQTKLSNYKYHVLNNRLMNSTILVDAKDALLRGKKLVILVSEIEHGEYFAKELNCKFARGSDKQSQEYVNMFNKGQINCLVGTQGRVGEGTDLKPVDCLIMASFNAGKGVVIQAIGRGLRKQGNKTECEIFDYIPEGCQMLSRHAFGRVSYYQEITDDVEVID